MTAVLLAMLAGAAVGSGITAAIAARRSVATFRDGVETVSAVLARAREDDARSTEALIAVIRESSESARVAESERMTAVLEALGKAIGDDAGSGVFYATKDGLKPAEELEKKNAASPEIAEDDGLTGRIYDPSQGDQGDDDAVVTM